jgi:hypothetical protein
MTTLDALRAAISATAVMTLKSLLDSYRTILAIRQNI